MKKYEVISENFWTGDTLVKKGTIVDIDEEKVKVSPNSQTLKPVQDKPEKK